MNCEQLEEYDSTTSVGGRALAAQDFEHRIELCLAAKNKEKRREAAAVPEVIAFK